IRIFLLALVFLPGVTRQISRADIYMYKDSNGVLHMGNRADAKQRGTLFMKETPRHRIPSNRNAREIMKIIEQTAVRHNVDPALALAVAQAESSFRPDAVSPKGAIGVMQLMPDTARRLKVRDVYKPEDNIDGGIRYLKQLLGLFPDDLHLAVAAYNAGENRVIRTGEIPNIPETKDYVDRVIRYYNGYKNGRSTGKESPTVGRPVKKTLRDDGTIVLSNL
ncbi:MAG TPA: lytic transglycosylase domain-containing protein, partial [bacterium]|nr:lytic transglycosylase domain-containing protein [bacterium]